jgi:2'-5' RNA ligase
MRLFIGLPLSREAERGVERVIEKLQKKYWKMRWELAENWHVTLAFLGDQPVDKINGIFHQLKQEPLVLKFKGLGRFPEIGRKVRFGERVRGRTAKRIRLLPREETVLPELLYLDFKGDLQTLAKLQKEVVAALRKSG